MQIKYLQDDICNVRRQGTATQSRQSQRFSLDKKVYIYPADRIST